MRFLVQIVVSDKGMNTSFPQHSLCEGQRKRGYIITGVTSGNFVGSGTGLGKFHYAGEAREIFWNSVIETRVLRVPAGWLVGSSLLLC